MLHAPQSPFSVLRQRSCTTLVAAVLGLTAATATARQQAPSPVLMPLTPAELPAVPLTLDGDWHWNGAGRQGVARFDGPTALLIHGDGTASPFGRLAYDPATGRVWFDLDDGAFVATGLAFGGVMHGILVSQAGPPYRSEPWCAARQPGCVPGDALPSPSPIADDAARPAAGAAGVEPPPAPAEATGATVQVGSRRVVAGDTFWIPVWLLASPGLDRLSVLIAYPPTAAAPDGDPVGGYLAGAATFGASTLPGGVLHLTLDGLGGATGTGTLAQVPLKAIGLSGVRAPLVIRIVRAADVQGRPVDVASMGGLLDIVSNTSPAAGSRLAGDADGDGIVTAGDAMIASKMTIRTAAARLAADTDADSYVTAEDVRQILAREMTLPARVAPPPTQAPPASVDRFTAIVTAGHGRAVPGADTRVSLVATGGATLGALQIDVAFDSTAARVESLVVGPGWPDALVDWRLTSPGRLRVAAAGAVGATPGAEILIVTMRLLDGGPVTSSVAVADGRAWDHATGFEVRLQAAAGSVTRDRWAWTPTRTVVTVVGAVALLTAAGLLVWVFGRRRKTGPPDNSAPAEDADRTTTICAKCHAVVPQGVKTCTGCGAQL